MKRETEISLMERVFEHIKNRSCDMAETVTKIPVSNYTCEQRFEKEKQVLFRHFPVVVGYSSQLANVGDYITHELTDVPIIVSRQKDGSLSAFINACRHRGARLTHEPSGNTKRTFVCPFHAWGFSCKDGKLKGVPRAYGFPELDKSQYALARLPVAERYGVIFVVPTAIEGSDDEAFNLDIDKYLGPMAADLDTWGFNSHKVFKAANFEKKLNWKLHLDINCETYHFRELHGKTAGEVYLKDVSVMDYVKPHFRGVAPQCSIVEQADLPKEQWQLNGHAGLLYTMFPNTLFFVSTGFAHVLSVFPQDVDNVVFQSAMLVPNEPDTEQNTQLWQLHFDNYWQTMVEDIHIGESMHSTMRSGAQKEIIFGRYEHISAAFEQAVDDAINGNFTKDDVGKD